MIRCEVNTIAYDAIALAVGFGVAPVAFALDKGLLFLGDIDAFQANRVKGSALTHIYSFVCGFLPSMAILPQVAP